MHVHAFSLTIHSNGCDDVPAHFHLTHTVARAAALGAHSTGLPAKCTADGDVTGGQRPWGFAPGVLAARSAAAAHVSPRRLAHGR